MILTLGQTLLSTACNTSVVVVRAPAGDVDLSCGGAPMVDKAAAGGEPTGPAAGLDTGSLVGKRYADESLGLELLCTKAGAGTLAIAGEPLALKDAKALPASD